MKFRRPTRFSSSRGQSLVETALILPLLIMIVLNVVNLGYFFLVAVNLQGAARSGVLYAIQGASTPSVSAIPSSGGTTPGTSTASVTYLVFQDLTGAVWNPTSVTVQVCSQANVDSSGAGVNTVTGGVIRSNCETCSSGNGCTPVNGAAAPTGYKGDPVPDFDPEASTTSGGFVLNQVRITYTFNTLIPGKIFNIPLQASAMCNSGTCTFIRQAEMRAMN